MQRVFFEDSVVVGIGRLLGYGSGGGKRRVGRRLGVWRGEIELVVLLVQLVQLVQLVLVLMLVLVLVLVMVLLPVRLQQCHPPNHFNL